MHTVVHTPHAPVPIGPYVQAVKTGNTLYVSGQLGIDPTSGLLLNLTVEQEAERALANVEAILSAGGCTLEQVVRVDLFLTDLNNFERINTVYAQWLAQVPTKPARQTVEVAALPKGARIEVSCIASTESL